MRNIMRFRMESVLVCRSIMRALLPSMLFLVLFSGCNEIPPARQILSSNKQQVIALRPLKAIIDEQKIDNHFYRFTGGGGYDDYSYSTSVPLVGLDSVEVAKAIRSYFEKETLSKKEIGAWPTYGQLSQLEFTYEEDGIIYFTDYLLYFGKGPTVGCLRDTNMLWARITCRAVKKQQK